MSSIKNKWISGVVAALFFVLAFANPSEPVNAGELKDPTATYVTPEAIINVATNPDEQDRENRNAVASAGRQNMGMMGVASAIYGYDRMVHASEVELPDDEILVIDLSYWQDPDRIDYDAVSEQVGAVILRIGYTGDKEGSNLYADTRFIRHYEAFKSRGVPVGGYWYACADTVEEGIAEAEFTLQVIQGLEFDLPIFWDTEDNNHQAMVSPEELTDAGLAYLNTIANAGYQTGVYASAWWLNNRLEMDRLNDYPVWVADWGGKATPGYNDYQVWQFTSKGIIDGYAGYLDFNFLKKDMIKRPVTLDANGGFFEAIESVWTEYGLLNQFFSPGVLPTREAHIFGGWYRDLACTVPWDAMSDRMTPELTLHARWEPVYQGIYHIRSSHNDMVMQIEDSSRVNGSSIVQAEISNSPNQQWRLEHMGDGYYKITSLLNPSHTFSASGNGITEGARLVQWLYDGRESQQWRIMTHNDGSVSLVSRLVGLDASDYRLQVNPMADEPGEPIFQGSYSESDVHHWYLEEAKPFTVDFDSQGGSSVSSASVRWNDAVIPPLIPTRDDMVFSGWYKDVEGDTPWSFTDDRVTQDLTLYAKWEPIYDGVFYLRSKHNGRVMGIIADAVGNGTPITPHGLTGDASQRWRVEHVGSGNYKISSIQSPDYTFAASGDGISEGAPLIKWQYDASPGQHWRISTNRDGSISLKSSLADQNNLDYRLRVNSGLGRSVEQIVQSTYDGSSAHHWYLEEPHAFTDLPTGFWAYDYISRLYNQDIVSGYLQLDGTTRFNAYGNITRGQAAKMIVRAGLDADDYAGKSCRFEDVPDGHEFSPYIGALTELGAIRGLPNGNYNMHGYMTRRQIAQVVVRAFDLDYGHLKISFTDLPTDGSEENIKILASLGIVDGYEDGTFRPNAPVSRAQFSKILSLAMESLG